MKEKFFNFCEKYLTGGYSLKIKKDLYLGFPKLAPIFTVAFITATVGNVSGIPIVEYLGVFLVAVGVFGFFYYSIFPSRRPKLPFIKPPVENDVKK